MKNLIRSTSSSILALGLAALLVTSSIPAGAQGSDHPMPRRTVPSTDDPSAPPWLTLELQAEIGFELPPASSAGGLPQGNGGIIGRLESATAGPAAGAAGSPEVGAWRAQLRVPVRTKAILGDQLQPLGASLEIGGLQLDCDPAMDAEAIELCELMAMELRERLAAAVLDIPPDRLLALELERSGRIPIAKLFTPESFWKGSTPELELRLPDEPRDVQKITVRVGPADPRSQRALDEITTYDPFRVVVLVPRAMAGTLGNTLTVDIHSATADDDTSVSVHSRRSGGRGPVVYSTEDPVTLEGGGPGGDSATPIEGFEFSWGDMDPLDTVNGDVVTFTCQGASTSVHAWKTWVQQGIAAEKRFFEAVKTFLSSHRGNPGLKPADLAAIDSKLRLIENAYALLAYTPKADENFTDYTRLLIAQGYHRMLLDDPANWGGAIGFKNPHFGIETRTPAETETLNAAIREGRERYRSAFHSTLAQATIGAYRLFTTIVLANQVYTAITGTDCMGRPVDLTTRVLAGVDAGSQLLLVGAITAHNVGGVTGGNTARAANHELAMRVRTGGYLRASERAGNILLGRPTGASSTMNPANHGMVPGPRAEAAVAAAEARRKAAAGGSDATSTPGAGTNGASTGAETSGSATTGSAGAGSKPSAGATTNGAATEGTATNGPVKEGAPSGSTPAAAEPSVAPDGTIGDVTPAERSAAAEGLPLPEPRRGARLDESDLPPSRDTRDTAPESGTSSPSESSTSAETKTSVPTGTSTTAETKTHGGMTGSLGPKTGQNGGPTPPSVDRPATRYSKKELQERLARERARRSGSGGESGDGGGSGSGGTGSPGSSGSSSGKIAGGDIPPTKNPNAPPTKTTPDLDAPNRPPEGASNGSGPRPPAGSSGPGTTKVDPKAIPPRPGSSSGDKPLAPDAAPGKPLGTPPTVGSSAKPLGDGAAAGKSGDATPPGAKPVDAEKSSKKIDLPLGEAPPAKSAPEATPVPGPAAPKSESNGGADAAANAPGKADKAAGSAKSSGSEKKQPESPSAGKPASPAKSSPGKIHRADKDLVTEADVPREYQPWTAPNGEVFHLGKRLGKPTANARVYEIIAGKHKGRVLKVYEETERVLTGWDPVKKEPIVESLRVIDDVIYGSEILEAHGFEQMRVYEASTRGNRPYLVQEAFPKGSFIPERNQVLLEAQEAAVIDLYARLSQKGLAWEDGHRGNVLLVPDGDGWKAVMFDTDRLVMWGQIPSKRLESLMHRPSELAALEGGRPELTNNILSNGRLDDWRPQSALEYMTKMLEYKGWIRFNRKAYQFERPTSGAGLDPFQVNQRIPLLERVTYPSPSGAAPTIQASPAPRTIGGKQSKLLLVSPRPVLQAA